MANDPLPIRVATYNLHHGVGSDGRYRRRRMVAACASLGADVLALQELDRRAIRTWFCDQPGRIAEAGGLRPIFATTRHLGPLGRYGLALLTRWPATEVEVLELPASAERRLAIIATVPWPDPGGQAATVRVVSTHLQNDAAVAMGQLEMLLGHVAGDDRPTLLLGDLNCGADLVMPALAAHGFRAADSGATFPARMPRRRIDWIAARGLELGDVTVHESRPGEVAASDHCPVAATCHLGPPPHVRR